LIEKLNKEGVVQAARVLPKALSRDILTDPELQGSLVQFDAMSVSGMSGRRGN